MAFEWLPIRVHKSKNFRDLFSLLLHIFCVLKLSN